MAQQYYNLYYTILPVKLSNMNVLMFHLTASQFFKPIFAKISTKRSLDRFELTEPKYKTKDLIPYELCLIFCEIDFFFFPKENIVPLAEHGTTRKRDE